LAALLRVEGHEAAAADGVLRQEVACGRLSCSQQRAASSCRPANAVPARRAAGVLVLTCSMR
jgi:hypothetical protein